MSKKKANISSGGQSNGPEKRKNTHNYNIYETSIEKAIAGNYVFPEYQDVQSLSLKDIPDYANPFSSFPPYVAEIKIPAKPSGAEIEKLRNQIEKLKQKLEESDRKWNITLQRHNLLRYFSREDTEAIIKRELKLKKKGRCEMTILNCDIRNFTKFTNELTDQEYLTELLNSHLVRCTEIIHKHGGAVDKYMGDGILAYFGCFSIGNNHAENACKAAKRIIKEGDVIFKSWYKKLLRRPQEKYLAIGIGIDTGYVHWDVIGHPDRQELSIIGPHVNLASRLQSEAGPGEILISGVTEGVLGKEWSTKTIDKEIKIKGFADKVDVFQLVWQ